MRRKSYLPKQMTDLRNYTKEDIYDHIHEIIADDPGTFVDWAIDTYRETCEEIVMDAYLADNPPDPDEDMDDTPPYISDDALTEYLDASDLMSLANEYAEHLAYGDYFDSNPTRKPAYMDFQEVRLVKNEWLLHFTNNNEFIAKNGFTRGVNDFRYLSRTEAIATELKMNGGENYNFAYLVEDWPSHENTSGYGRDAVMFRANGVLFEQVGDERQVIFYGNTAKNIIPLTYNGKGVWRVVGYVNGRELFKGPLKAVTEWVKDHFQQYRRELVWNWGKGQRLPQSLSASLRKIARLLKAL
jgi:hypothetical protein